MGGSALIALLATGGNVGLLVVLYSINVFITFSLSQSGMVRHWWHERPVRSNWKWKMFINGTGLCLTTFILISVCVVKFTEGGWITLVITGLLVVTAFVIRRHYAKVSSQLQQLNEIVKATEVSPPTTIAELPCDPKARTAVFLVNGFNGIGLHTVLQTTRLFGSAFANFVFVQIGVVDAGNFKGVSEMQHLQTHVQSECARYVAFMQRQGQRAEMFTAFGRDVVEEVVKLAPQITKRFPKTVFFGGQLVFERETIVSRWLHNYTVFALQRRLYLLGLPFVTLPIRLREK